MLMLLMMALLLADVTFIVHASGNYFHSCGEIGQSEELTIFESGMIKRIEPHANRSILLKCGMECNIRSNCYNIVYNKNNTSCLLSSNYTSLQTNSTDTSIVYVNAEFMQTGFTTIIFDDIILTESLLQVLRGGKRLTFTLRSGTDVAFVNNCYEFHVSDERSFSSNEVELKLSKRHVTKEIGLTINSSLCDRKESFEYDGSCYTLIQIPNVQMDFENTTLVCSDLSERIASARNDEVSTLMKALLAERKLNNTWIDADEEGQCQVLSDTTGSYNYNILNVNCNEKYGNVFCVQGTQQECSADVSFYWNGRLKCCRALNLSVTWSEGYQICVDYFFRIVQLDLPSHEDGIKAFVNAAGRNNHHETFWIGLSDDNSDGIWRTDSGKLALNATNFPWQDPVAAISKASIKCAYVKKDSQKVFVSNCEVKRGVICQYDRHPSYIVDAQFDDEARKQVWVGDYPADFGSQSFTSNFDLCGKSFNSIFLNVRRTAFRKLGRINVCLNVTAKQITVNNLKKT